jgi:hypothetical protein
LEVTDREFREMRYTLPLSQELARRVAAEQPRRVLLVGTDVLLAEALKRMGMHSETSSLSLDVAPHVVPSQREGENEISDVDTAVIVFPPESIDAERLLSKLSERITGRGSMIIAIPRAMGSARLVSWARAAGWQVTEITPVIAQEAWSSGQPLTVSEWVRAEALHAARRGLPRFRSCLIVTLDRQINGRRD